MHTESVLLCLTNKSFYGGIDQYKLKIYKGLPGGIHMQDTSHCIYLQDCLQEAKLLFCCIFLSVLFLHSVRTTNFDLLCSVAVSGLNLTKNTPKSR